MLGTHLIVELRSCKKSELLNNVIEVEKIMVEAAMHAKATVISANFHAFHPHGVSGVVIIAESHLTIHTWPEHLYAAVDVFTCGKKIDPAQAVDFLVKAFECEKIHVEKLKRGPQ